MARDDGFVRFLSYGMVIYSWAFSVLIVAMAPYLTSRQWTYLLSIPGGEWTWLALFGSAAVAALYGLRRRRKWPIVAGLFLMASWCTCIVAFYIAASFYDPALINLGYVPWGGMAAVMYCIAFRELRC